MYLPDDPRDTSEPSGQPRETRQPGVEETRAPYGSARGGPFEEAETAGPRAGEAEASGDTRFTFQSTPPPLIAIGCINGRLSVRARQGEGGDRAAILRATDESGASVPLDHFADVTFDPVAGILRVEPVTAIRRQFQHLLRGVTYREGHLFEHLLELVERLGYLGIRWPVIDIDATVPPDCKLELSSASGTIDVAGMTGPVTIRTASAPVQGATLTGGVTARTVSGALALRDASGAVHAQSVSGEVTLDGVSGASIVHTVSGDVVARDVRGAFGFKSVSGDLEVRSGNIDRLYASTTSGDIEIDAELGPAAHELRTVSGSVTLQPQAGFVARLSGRTLSGDLTCHLPYTASEGGSADTSHPDDREEPRAKESRRRGKNRWEYLIGDRNAAARADTRLRVRTVSGSLTIEAPRISALSGDPSATSNRFNDGTASTARGDAAREPALDHTGTDATSPPQERHLRNAEVSSSGATAQEPRLAVLEALQRDELSTEEALRLLAELDGGS